MRLLLDTHSFLWFISGHPHLSVTARELIEDSTNLPLLSVASLWEMAINTAHRMISELLADCFVMPECLYRASTRLDSR